MTRVTRRYSFCAMHRLDSPQLSASHNAELYGKCNNEFGHGHDYTLEVSVVGDTDAGTGRVIAPGDLDRYVGARVLERLDGRDMNRDVPELNGVIPTTENLAERVAAWLCDDWSRSGFPARLAGVRIEETKRNSVTLDRI